MVEIRSNSRNSGATLEESEIAASGRISATAMPSACSRDGSRNENRVLIATASGARSSSTATASLKSSPPETAAANDRRGTPTLWLDSTRGWALVTATS